MNDKLIDAIEALAGELEATAVRMSIAREERQFARDIAMKLRALLSTHGENGEGTHAGNPNVYSRSAVTKKVIGTVAPIHPASALDSEEKKKCEAPPHPCGLPPEMAIGYHDILEGEDEQLGYGDAIEQADGIKPDDYEGASAPEGWRGPWKCDKCGAIGFTEIQYKALNEGHYNANTGKDCTGTLHPYDRRASDDARRMVYNAFLAARQALEYWEQSRAAHKADHATKTYSLGARNMITEALRRYPVAEKKEEEG
jgi:hypothetical protein